MPIASWGRAAKVGILLALIASTILLSESVNSLAQGITVRAGGKFFDCCIVSIANNDTGWILVRVALMRPSLLGTPIPNVNVSLLRTDAGTIVPLSLRTDSNGSIKFPLEPGGYAVTVADPRFHLFTTVKVLSQRLTELDVDVKRTDYPAQFFEVSSRDSSGWLETWNTITVMVSENTPISQANRTVFLNFVNYVGFGNNGTLLSFTIVQINSTHGSFRIIAVDAASPLEAEMHLLSADMRPSGLWLTLSPSAPLSISGVSAVLIESYNTQYRVNTYGF
ncbi:MAG: carboxypeptidase-like regulatory domain-containing protein [Thaumarchaeota archaeon]|nr:carboxypeptidase-like regulatory domain-containing protein [Nitrososphaerota archaeon]